VRFWGLLPCFALSLSACTAPPHKFIVSVDREPKSALLTLNGTTLAMKRQGSTFITSRHVSDASGKISVYFADGSVVVCVIGYITNGEFEPHHFAIVDQKCHGA
jgi:hypothetical protein